ncbi:MAG: hypothetical protein GC166_04540 [Alphaproteobacteria bacterium]|nr:hypothetical protein [Alphaproteobacteria bacterium]
MLKYILHRRIAAMERQYGYDATYLHYLCDVSPVAAYRFVKAQTSARWRGNAPRTAWHAASIGGALVEDCGPCVQIATDIAVGDGVKGDIIGALLSGGPTDADAQLGFDYGRALLQATDKLDSLREQVENRWGKRGLVALSFMAMYSRNYPVLKRALGHAKTCQKVRIGQTDIAVAQSLKAA